MLGILSVGEFEQNTNELLEQVRGTGSAITLTVDGKAQFVVQDAAAYQKLLDRIDELETLEGIQKGIADVESGRVTPLRQFEQEFRAQRGLPSRTR